MKPRDFVGTARRLAESKDKGAPRQSDLRRAQSTVYYALFHALCGMCADTMIGTTGAQRSTPAWLQAYRAVDHSRAKRLFSGDEKPRVLTKFPNSLQDFANGFVKLQLRRHDADYDPSEKFIRDAVLSDIETTEALLETLKKVSLKDKRAFCAWVLFKVR